LAGLQFEAIRCLPAEQVYYSTEQTVNFFLTQAIFLGQAAGGSAGNPLSGLIILIPLFGLMYFLLYRPQQQRQKQLQEMLSKLKVGDRVMTSSGALGVISKVSERTVHITLADKVEIEFIRAAVAEVIKSESENPADKTK
jgi:preprotein translocase subunit YajC